MRCRWVSDTGMRGDKIRKLIFLLVLSAFRILPNEAQVVPLREPVTPAVLRVLHYLGIT